MKTHIIKTLQYHEADQVYQIKQAFYKMKKEQKPRRIHPIYTAVLMLITPFIYLLMT